MAITPIMIRAAARGGKFLGTDAGGAKFWVNNVTIGEIYVQGQVVNGDSGPSAMMTTPMLRDTPLPVDSETAGLLLKPDLDRPSLLWVAVEGPLLYPSQSNSVTTWSWVLPGVGTIPTPPDPSQVACGLVIDIPGLCTNVASQNYNAANRTLSVSANVMMMCGCKVGAILPLMATSPWPPSDFNVQLVAHCAPFGVLSFTIPYSGTPSVYTISQILPAVPDWAMITAAQISMGQSGRCTVLGNPPLTKQISVAELMPKL